MDKNKKQAVTTDHLFLKGRKNMKKNSKALLLLYDYYLILIM